MYIGFSPPKSLSCVWKDARWNIRWILLGESETIMNHSRGLGLILRFSDKKRVIYSFFNFEILKIHLSRFKGKSYLKCFVILLRIFCLHILWIVSIDCMRCISYVHNVLFCLFKKTHHKPFTSRAPWFLLWFFPRHFDGRWGNSVIGKVPESGESCRGRLRGYLLLADWLLDRLIWLACLSIDLIG